MNMTDSHLSSGPTASPGRQIRQIRPAWATATGGIGAAVLLALVAIIPVASSTAASTAATPAATTSARPSTTQFLTLSTAELRDAITADVQAEPAAAGIIVAQVLSAGRPDTRAITRPVVATGIRALGQKPAPSQVGDIVYKAVKTIPEAVLDIVRVATQVAPHAAEEIIEAAISALDDPWKEILYVPTPPGETTFAVESDGKTLLDGKMLLGDRGFQTDKGYGPGTPLPAAEAIVLAVAESAPGLDTFALYAAADRALSRSPLGSLRALSDPKVISPVGDAGRTQFGNEPRLTPVSE